MKWFTDGRGLALAFTGDSYDFDSLMLFAYDVLGRPFGDGHERLLDSEIEDISREVIEFLRRGVLVVKEPVPDGMWTTDHAGERELFWGIALADSTTTNAQRAQTRRLLGEPTN